MIDRAGADDERRRIPQAVLRIEHDGGETFARDCFRDDGRANHAPGSINRFARTQASGKVERRHLNRSS
jgi:hypothetical protein